MRRVGFEFALLVALAAVFSGGILPNCATAPRPCYVTMPDPETVAGDHPGNLREARADFDLWLATNQCNGTWFEESNGLVWACARTDRYGGKVTSQEEDVARTLATKILPWIGRTGREWLRESHPPIVVLSGWYPIRFVAVKVER